MTSKNKTDIDRHRKASADSHGRNHLRTSSLFGTIVFIQFLLISSLKIYYSKTQQPYNPHDETAYYWSESAFQYRYAKMAGEGREIPEIDRDAQFPEGVATYRELTLGMERTTGLVYRLVNSIHPITFNDYLIYFYAIFSSLSVLAFYFAAFQFCRSPLFACLMTAAYTFNPSSWIRLIGNYEYEGFALPWIFLSFALFLAALRAEASRSARKAAGYSIFAGISLCVSLLSWHFSRFYLIVFVAAICIDYFVIFNDDAATGALMRVTSTVTLCCILAGVFFPLLRLNAFLMSLPMSALYVLALAHIVKSRMGLTRLHWLLTCFGGGILSMAAVRLSGLTDSSAYGHVYDLFIYKIRFLFHKPMDPQFLPMDARMLWISPFNTPTLGRIFYYYFPLAAPASIWIIAVARARKAHVILPDGDHTRGILAILMALAFAALYLFVERLLGMAVFFGALAILLAITNNVRSRPLALALLLCLSISEIAKATLGNTPLNLFYGVAHRLSWPAETPFGEFSHKLSLIKWIEARTRPKDRFLSGMGIAPLILTYADRAVIIQPKFESSTMRAKYAEFLGALFNNEDRFFAFCKKYGADYFVYESRFVLDGTAEGERYTANALVLPTSSAAFQFHFSPATLRNFSLVYQDADYRVFRIGKKAPAGTFIPASDPVYSRDEISLATSKSLGPDGTTQLLDKLSKRMEYIKQAEKFTAEGHLDAAAGDFEKILVILPTDADIWLDLARLDLRLKRDKRALAEAKRSADLNPNLLDSQSIVAGISLQLGKPSIAEPALKRIIELAPLDPVAYNNLGVIYFQRHAYPESLRYFEKAYRLRPTDPDYAGNFKAVLKKLGKPFHE